MAMNGSGEINFGDTLPATLAYAKVDRGTRWMPVEVDVRVEVVDPATGEKKTETKRVPCQVEGGKQLELEIAWISPRREQEILAPAMIPMMSEAWGLSRNRGEDDEDERSLRRYRTLQRCQRELAYERVVGWRQFTIANHDVLTHGGEAVLGPKQSNDEAEAEANRADYNRMRKEHVSIPFGRKLFDLVLSNAGDALTNQIIQFGKAWEADAASRDNLGNSDSPTSPAR